jgi:hypothetical protein
MGPLYVYARLFLAATNRREKAEVFSQAVEWLENKAETTFSDGLKDRLLSILLSPEGESFLRWATNADA